MPGKSREYHRFMSKVEQNTPDGCWVWMGFLNKDGYGIHNTSTPNLAHRYSYMLFNGLIAPDMNILHRCDNRPCVNPRHLFQGSHNDNVQDMMQKSRFVHWNTGKSHCKAGHEFTPENTRIRKNTNRTCKECEKIRHNKRKKGV